LVNLIHFISDDALFVRGLVTRFRLHDLFFEFLQRHRELDETLMLWVLGSLVIAHDHHPAELRAAARRHCEVLREMAENTTLNTSLIESILLWESLEEMDHV
jgi:hypothetical protein